MGVNVIASAIIDGRDVKRYLPRSLSVVSVDFVCDDDLELITRITQQLPLGTPVPRIRIMLPRCELGPGAQAIADHYHEPVVVCDMGGRLLAYRTPQ